MKVNFTLFIAALLLLPEVVLPASASSKPNVIVVLVDDMGYGDVAAHGNPPWNHGMVAGGSKLVGDWKIRASCAGTYRFGVRRWPR
ncbi:MAG: hypothetical protein WCS43_19585, partial [Verrucomicrobiota bacterium]